MVFHPRAPLGNPRYSPLSFGTPRNILEHCPCRNPIMDHSLQSIPLCAGALVVSKVIDSVAKILPSQLEKRGDRKLDNALGLAEEYKDLISESDLDTIARKISQ
jgi:hypothetical protein